MTASTAQPRRRHQQATVPIGPFRQVTEPLPMCISPRLVVTIATGQLCGDVLDVTRPSMQHYAERCRADYIELRDTTQSWPLYEKFRLRAIAEQYEQTLFLDADCLVSPTCPDLFEQFPFVVAMRDDAPNWNADWMLKKWPAVMESQGVHRTLETPIRAWNTGVVLCDRAHAFLWEPPERPLPGGHEDEQVWVQATLQDRLVEVHDLGPGFNDQWYYPTFRERLAQTHIAHFACCPNKLAELKILERSWSPF